MFKCVKIQILMAWLSLFVNGATLHHILTIGMGVNNFKCWDVKNPTKNGSTHKAFRKIHFKLN